jgi:hypothetical protein
VKKKNYKQIAPKEAFRAIYIDFEGFMKDSPSLIGIACEYEFKQVVLSEGLYPAAEAKGLETASLERIGQELLARSDDENRLIVGYSQLERKILWKYGSVDVQQRYRDARMIGRRWINRVHRGEVTEWGLMDLLQLMGYEVPTHLGKGLVTKRLRGVLRGLEVNAGRYEDLTPVQKAKWTKLLRYNRVDCLATRDLVMRAVSEISVSETAPKAEERASERRSEPGGGLVPSDRKQTNVRLSDEGRELLEQIANTYSLPFSSVIELAVRKYAEEMGIWSPG